jgi:hypothetical protein
LLGSKLKQCWPSSQSHIPQLHWQHHQLITSNSHCSFQKTENGSSLHLCSVSRMMTQTTGLGESFQIHNLAGDLKIAHGQYHPFRIQ